MSQETAERELEAAALQWFARLPLLRADDVQTLTGAHEADVRRALEALARFGWIERVRASSPEFDEEYARFVLRDVAVPAFIQTFQLDEEEARRSWPIGRNENLAHVSHLEITDYVNGLLVSLVDCHRDALTAVVDVRALPHSRRDAESWWPRDVEGYGCLAYGNRFAHFFVAWDRAGAPSVHRRARVRAWYDAAQAYDY